MYAGFKFWFKLQGRDAYSNNVRLTLEETVGVDISAALDIFVGDEGLRHL